MMQAVLDSAREQVFLQAAALLSHMQLDGRPSQSAWEVSRGQSLLQVPLAVLYTQYGVTAHSNSPPVTLLHTFSHTPVASLKLHTAVLLHAGLLDAFTKLYAQRSVHMLLNHMQEGLKSQVVWELYSSHLPPQERRALSHWHRVSLTQVGCV